MTSLHPARSPRPARPGQPAGWPPGRPRRRLPGAPGAGPAGVGMEDPRRRPRRARRGGTGVPGHHHPGLRAVPVHRRLRHPGHRHPGRTAPAVRRGGVPGPAGLAARRAWSPTPASSSSASPAPARSTLVKRQLTGAVATGTRVLVLGDTKPDYSMLVEHLGGQVIRVGRGLDRINPLDAGPLGAALRRMSGPDAQALRWEVRSRRLSLLMALCTLIRGAPITNAEEVILGRAIDLLDDRLISAQPAVTDVLAVIEQGPDTLRAAARADTPAGFRDRVADLVFTLDLLCTG